MEGKNIVQKITKKTVKTQKIGTLKELIKTFQDKITAFKIHYFNWKHQQQNYRDKIANLGPTEALLLCDFSENYECKANEEVQASHFIKSQITLHCGMIYWADKCQSFCSISDNKCHEPSAIWAHLLPVIRLIKSNTPQVKTVHFHSDGPSSQYRQKKNFFLLNHFTTKLDFDYCTWNFSESGHGKGVADGIGGAVKRSLDKQVAYGRDITDGQDAFKILKSLSKTIKYFYVEDSEINCIAQSCLPRDLKAVPGTLRIHQIISYAYSSYIQHRLLSCFCRLDKDQVCNCFSLKKHKYDSSQLINQIPICRTPELTHSEIYPTARQSISKPANNLDINVIVSKHGALSSEPNSIKNLNSTTKTDYSASRTSSDILANESNDTVASKTVGVDCSNPLNFSTLKPLASVSIIDLASGDITIDCADMSSPKALTLSSISIIDPDFIVTSAVAVNQTKASSDLITMDSVPINDLILKYDTDSLESSTAVANISADFIDKDCKIRSASLESSVMTDNDVPVKIDLTKLTLSNFSPKRKSTTTSTTSGYKTPIKKARISSNEKENIATRNKNRSIRTVVSRCLKCAICEENVPFNSRNIVKCIACFKWFCATCTEGIMTFDYICRHCFGPDD